jgi:hypothetical protein
VLGGQPVVDRQHPDPGRRGEQSADAVVGIEVTDHPTAAVVVDEQRRRLARRRGLGDVEAGGQRAARAGNVEGAHLGHRDRSAVFDHLRLVARLDAGFLDAATEEEALAAGQFGQL